LLATLVAASLLGCAAPRPSGDIALVGDVGDTVRLSAPARRIVSLLPTATELLFGIGVGDRVVGRTAWCDAPDAARAVPNLGDGLNPNLEAIAAASPDLVLLYPSALNDVASARLAELGIPTLRLRTDRLADVPRLARLLARATGRGASGDSLAAAFEAGLAAARQARADGPSVFLLAWDEPLTALGPGSFLSELVELAGGHNAFPDLPTASAPVAIEAVAARDPDVVLVPLERPAPFEPRAAWQAIRAVRERHVLQVVGTEYLRPTPRAPGAVRALAGRLGQVP
jgi:ABC-type Fe3+-hydroxamate transport system substrate-binding protein